MAKKNHGPTPSLRRRLGRWLRVARRPWTWPGNRRREQRRRALESKDGFDATHGTETTAPLPGLNYGATPVRTFRRIMEAIPTPLDDCAFVDLGSGKGRALLLASEHPFRTIIGVEHSPELHAVAGRNLAKFLPPTGRADRFQLRCEDAADFVSTSWPEADDVLLFLYCPFPSELLRQVCAALQPHAEAGQRISIAFVNPNRHMERVFSDWPQLHCLARFEPPDQALAAYESFAIYSTGSSTDSFPGPAR